MTQSRTLALFAVIAASALLVRAEVATTSSRTSRPGAAPIAAALVRYVASTGVDSLVVRSDDTARGKAALAAARQAAHRYHLSVEPDGARAGPRDALLVLGSPDGAARICAIERPGRGIVLPPWLDDPHLLTTTASEVVVAKRHGVGLQLWTPATIEFLPPALAQGHGHASQGHVRMALVRSSLPIG